MSSYLIIKTRIAPGGKVTEALMRQMELSSDGDKVLNLREEQHWSVAGIANLMACGHSIYVGVRSSRGDWIYGDEVRIVGPHQDLESVDDEGLRTYALGKLPSID